MRISFLLVFTLVAVMNVLPQALPRRVYLGIRMENLTDDSKKLMGLNDNSGVLISEVLPESTAEEAGLKKGDLLISINEKKVSSTGEVIAVLSGNSGGQKFTFEYYRNKKINKGVSVFKKFPKEKYKDLEVIYTEAESAVGLERIIITKPIAEKRFPVIAFVGGIGCYSLDFPLDSTRSEVQLLNTLSRAGYLCARLEKPGIGDNANYSKSCNAVSFKEEMEGYVQAIKTLKQRIDVDSNSVLILGHSMGGVFAPMIAQRTALKGIVAYGLIGSCFPEYLAKTRRTIAEAYGMNPEETFDLIKDFSECASYYFTEKMTTETATTKKTVCGEYLSVFDLRSRAYNDELYALNIPGQWKSFTGKAAIIWGTSDYISSEEDHKIVADAINFYHPGNAEFLKVENADHGMLIATNFSESNRNPGPYNPEVGNVILEWLKKQQ